MSDTDSTSPILDAAGLVKTYEGGRIRALDGLNLSIRAGAFVAICGPSGCGKSTLLNMLAAIDRPDAGRISVDGRDLLRLAGDDADTFRRETVGLVFQLHNLLAGMTAFENVQVPMMANGTSRTRRAERAAELLERVGLADRMGSVPPELSGGERQRVAVARALANDPRILLADEPTGSLDSRTGDRLFDLLGELNRDLGTTLVVVTHDPRVAERAERVFNMLDGRFTPGDSE